MNEAGDELKSIGDKQTISGERDLINYKKISFYYGLHKDSLNHLSSMQMSVNRVKKLFQLRNTYQSIDRVEPILEEDDKKEQLSKSVTVGQK